jgi:hypothetical protein
MPFYDESGEAIIPKPKPITGSPPKTSVKYVEKPKPKPVVVTPSKPPQSIPTWKKKAVDVGFQSIAPVKGSPLSQKEEWVKRPIPVQQKPTYPGIYTKLSESRSNVEQAITGLRRPDTYYDPSKNAIVTGPLAMHPSFQKLTEEKVAELETTKKTIGEQRYEVSKLESKGYQIEKTTEGEYKFFKTGEQIEQEMVSKEKERLREYYYGDPGKKLAAWIHGTGTSLFSTEDPLSIPSAIQMAMGDKEGSLETKARASLHLTKAWEKGPIPFTLTIATGPLPMVGWSLLGGAAIGKASGFLAGYTTQAIGPGAATVIKGIEIGAGVAMGGLAVHDVARTYEEKGLPQAIGKGALYGFMAAAAYKGYKSVDRPAMISKGEASYFKKHPDALKFVFGKKGELVSSDVKIDAFSSRGTPTETKEFMLTRKSIWKPAGKKHVGITEAWSKEANIRSLQSIKDSKIHAWTEGHPALKKGPTVDYYGVGGAGMRGVDVKTSGVKPLVQSGETQFFSGQSGVKGSFFKRIFTTKIAKFSSAKDLTIKEAVGFGGITKTITKTVPMTTTKFVGSPQAAPAFMGLGGFSGITVPFISPILELPITKGKGELKQPVFIDEDITGKGRGLLLGPVFLSDLGKDTRRTGATKPVFDFSQYQDIASITDPITVEDIKTEQRTEIDQLLDLDEIIAPSTKTTGVFDFSFAKTPKKGQGFSLPSGLGGSGGTDEGFGWLTSIERKRKHRIGDILEELEKGFDF